MENINNEKLQYTLDKLYRCRDLEISNLWQRSVFLSVFIILCYTAYGYIVIEILSYKPKESLIKISYINLISIFISSVGIIFSIVWILMAKASKAWYEVYENAISEFENKYYECLGLPEENIMGNMGFPQKLRNDSIFTTKGGAFSPSKINVLIGQISLYLLIIFNVIHLYLIHCFTNDCKIYFYGFLISFITVIISISLSKSKLVKSGFLNL